MFGPKTAIEAAERVLSKCDSRCQGDRLMQARRDTRVETAKTKVAEAVAAKASALQVHRDKDTDEPFDPTPYDAEITKWEAELADRIALAAAQALVVAEGLELQASARKELFVEQRKALLIERQASLETTYSLNEQIGALDVKIGDDRFALTFLQRETLDNVDAAVKQHVQPIPRIDPSSLPLNCIRITSDGWSDGRCIYSRGEGIFLRSIEKAAEAVASGHATYQFVDAAQPAMVKAAKARLAAAARDRSGFLSAAGGGNVHA